MISQFISVFSVHNVTVIDDTLHFVLNATDRDSLHDDEIMPEIKDLFVLFVVGQEPIL